MNTKTLGSILGLAMVLTSANVNAEDLPPTCVKLMDTYNQCMNRATNIIKSMDPDNAEQVLSPLMKDNLGIKIQNSMKTSGVSATEKFCGSPDTKQSALADLKQKLPMLTFGDNLIPNCAKSYSKNPSGSGRGSRGTHKGNSEKSDICVGKCGSTSKI